MAHDPEFVAEARSWIARARADLRLAEIVRLEEASLHGDALFHCQQAAEKALKAMLTWHGRTFRKTHSLGELGQAVVEISPTLEPLLRAAVTLTDYAWKFRYPGDVEEPGPGEVDAALRRARDVYEAVLRVLPDEVRP